MREKLLTIAIDPNRGHVTLRLVGEIDMSCAESVRDAAFSAMHRHSTRVHLDMSGVTFMDSTGLQTILAVRRRAELAGGSVHLVDPARNVMRVLEVTGLTPLFEIVTASSAASDIGLPERRGAARFA